jgi:hypothetical protein
METLVALVESQVNVEDCPLSMEVGAAESVTVGAGFGAGATGGGGAGGGAGAFFLQPLERKTTNKVSKIAT